MNTFIKTQNIDKCKSITYFKNNRFIIELENKKNIDNNLNLFTNKIELLNGFGIIFYQNDVILKIIKQNYIKLDYDEHNDNIKIYFYNKYSKFDKIPDIILNLKDNYFNVENNISLKFKKDDKVFPRNIKIYKEDGSEISIYDMVFSILYNKYNIENMDNVLEKHPNKEVFKEYLLDQKEYLYINNEFNYDVFSELYFKVEDIYMNNIYSIKKLYTTQHLTNLTDIYYCDNKDLYSLEEIEDIVIKTINKDL